MSDRRTQVTTEVSPAPRAKVSRDTPFRILLLGDFGGAVHRETDPPPLAERRPQSVDADNRADVMQRMQVAARLVLPSGDMDPTAVTMENLDGFHPDQLIERVAFFDRFRRLRAQLQDASGFDQAAEEIRSWASWTEPDDGPPSAAPDQPTATHSPPSVSEFPDDLLDQTLEATQAGVDGRDHDSHSPWLEAIRDIVRPYAVPGKPPRQAELFDCLDQATSVAMNLILHAPPFQNLEANWRSVDLLLRRLPLSTQLKLYLVDVSKDELARDFASESDLTRTALFRWLADESERFSGGLPWAVIGGLFDFGPTAEDAQLLAKTAGIACHAGAPFVAGATPAMLGCGSLADMRDPGQWDPARSIAQQEVWSELRRWPEANYAGLVTPRWLLRLPYGADTSPTDSFSFEEMPGEPVHENYLWGHASVACVQVLAECFTRFGWQFQTAGRFEIDDLPLHTFDRDGESEVYPPAELYLTERAVDSVKQMGLNCLVSVRHRDAVQINSLRAITGNALGGAWSG